MAKGRARQRLEVITNHPTRSIGDFKKKMKAKMAREKTEAENA